MDTPIIVRNLTKKFGDVVAVNNVSLVIEPGTFLTLLGPSGCGKTTLLRCIAGLEDPDDGEIVIGEKLIFSRKKGISLPPGQRERPRLISSRASSSRLVLIRASAASAQSRGRFGTAASSSSRLRASGKARGRMSWEGAPFSRARRYSSSAWRRRIEVGAKVFRRYCSFTKGS